MFESLYSAIVNGQMPFSAFCGLMVVALVLLAIPVCIVGAIIEHRNRPEAVRARYYAARRAHRGRR